MDPENSIKCDLVERMKHVGDEIIAEVNKMPPVSKHDEMIKSLVNPVLAPALNAIGEEHAAIFGVAAAVEKAKTINSCNKYTNPIIRKSQIGEVDLRPNEEYALKKKIDYLQAAVKEQDKEILNLMLNIHRLKTKIAEPTTLK